MGEQECARAGHVEGDDVEGHLGRIADGPFERYPLAPLLGEAWGLRHNFRLADALYVALAEERGVGLLTADAALVAAYEGAEVA